MSKASMLKKWRFKQAANVDVICGICDEPISRGGDKGKGALTADHIIPKSLGGRNENANLQPAHARCNRERQNIILHQFKGHLKDEMIVKRAVELIDKYETNTNIRSR
jgi:5-methylcytosine-specific restriction endonuclease McrA